MEGYTMTDSSIFPELYLADRRDKAIFGSAYIAPDKFIHGVAAKVAEYKGNDDGQSCEVWETRIPARFFEVRVLPGKNSVGEVQHGYSLETGSSMGQLANDVAKAIAEGMIVLQKVTR